MELTTLQDYVAKSKKEYEDDQAEWKERNGGHYSGIPFEDEQLIFAILDYYTMKGEFTQEELDWLNREYDIDEHEVNLLING